MDSAELAKFIFHLQNKLGPFIIHTIQITPIRTKEKTDDSSDN